MTNGAPPARATTGLAGTVEGVVIAREAPYLAFVAQRQFAPTPELYVLDPSTGEPAAVLTAALRASFDLCADGTVVYAAPEGGVAVAAPPSFSPTALVVDGETLEGPFAILPDTGSTCRFIAQTGLERSAVIDARTGDVLLQLPFAARAGNATLTRFLEAGTVFAPASRIVDEQRNVVANLNGVMAGWCDEPRTGRFCGVDDTGLLHRWDWAGNDETVRISDRGDVLLPRQLWGELVFWRGTGTAGGQLHFFADGQRRVMDVSLGTFPFLSVATLPDDDLFLLMGARAIRALDGAAVRTRLAESTSEPYP